MKRSRSFVSSLLRVAGLTTGFAFSWVAVVASCSSSPAGRASSKNGADARADAALSCPVRSEPARCSGNDPTFVFFPPLTCDPGSSGDAGASDADASDDTSSGDQATPDGDAVEPSDADDAGDANAGNGAADPCALVTTLDVFFTPQACQAFVNAEASHDIASTSDPSAPVITEPADGDMLTPDEWSLFAWDWPPRDSRRDWFERSLDLIEPSAYAFSPLRGDAYVLEFTQGCTEILRVMSAEQLWLPDPASWALLTSLTGPVQVRVFWMRFAGDALVSMPVASVPITITMTADAGD